MQLVTARNTYHNSTASFRPLEIKPIQDFTGAHYCDLYKISEATLRRTWSKMCSIKGCACGSTLRHHGNDKDGNVWVSV